MSIYSIVVLSKTRVVPFVITIPGVCHTSEVFKAQAIYEAEIRNMQVSGSDTLDVQLWRNDHMLTSTAVIN